MNTNELKEKMTKLATDLDAVKNELMDGNRLTENEIMVLQNAYMVIAVAYAKLIDQEGVNGQRTNN